MEYKACRLQTDTIYVCYIFPGVGYLPWLTFDAMYLKLAGAKQFKKNRLHWVNSLKKYDSCD